MRSRAQDGTAGFAGLDQFEVLEPVQYHVKGNCELLASQMVAGTVFDPEPEGEDLGGFPVGIEPVGVRVAVRIPVGGGDAGQDERPLGSRSHPAPRRKGLGGAEAALPARSAAARG